MTLPRTPSFRLDGRRALVAGASSGIGAACAVALAEQGAEVTLCARREPELRALADEMQAAGMQRRHPATRHHRCRRDRGRAGRAARLSTCWSTPPGWPATRPRSRPRPRISTPVANLNLRAAYFLTRTVAKRLIAEGKPGSLINISSQMAHVGGIDRAVYSATKHARRRA